MSQQYEILLTVVRSQILEELAKDRVGIDSALEAKYHLRSKRGPYWKFEDPSARKHDLATQTLLALVVADYANPTSVGSAIRRAVQQDNGWQKKRGVGHLRPVIPDFKSQHNLGSSGVRVYIYVHTHTY